MAGPEYSSIERNLREAMQFFGHASGQGEVVERDGVLLIDSGVNYSVFNIAMLTDDVASVDVLQNRVRGAAAYFDTRQTRWSMWICDEMLAEPLRRRAAVLFANERLRRLTEAPGMLADSLRAPVRLLPSIECRPVASPSERADFAHITSVNFDIPFATCQMVYGNEQAWSHNYHGFVGYSNGTAVTTVAAVPAAGSIGIYSVSTLPHFRRRGFAEALMRHVIGKYHREAGIQRTVLQATRAGYEMYTKMGYRVLSRFTVYMT